MRNIFCALTVLFILAPCCLAQREQRGPEINNKTPVNLFSLPDDGKSRWVRPWPYSKRYAKRFPTLSGVGSGRTAKEAHTSTDTTFVHRSLQDDGDTLPDVSSTAIIAWVGITKSGGINRMVLIYLDTTPREGDSHIGSRTLELEAARKLLMCVNEALRLGRMGRQQGVATANKRVEFAPIGSATGTLRIAIERIANKEWSVWYVASELVVFSTTELSDLSRFRDNLDAAVTWLSKQK